MQNDPLIHRPIACSGLEGMQQLPAADEKRCELVELV